MFKLDLPCKECKGKCCTYPAMSKEEFETIKSKYGILKKAKVMDMGVMVMAHLPNGNCPWLSNGECSVYALRPITCRKYGDVPELPYAYLYPEKAKASFNTMRSSIENKLEAIINCD